MHTYCLINGEFKKTTEPVIKVNDLGLLRGYGVFDFLPVQQSQPVFFNDYWNRFRNSALKMRLTFEWDRDSFLNQLHELIRKNDFTGGYCRLLLTGGYSSNGFLPDGPSNFMVTTQGPIHYPEKNFNQGIKLITLEYAREYPQIKSINYMTLLLERDRLRDEMAEDVLYLSENNVTESSRSNFFIIDSDGVLVTPMHHILPGITRSKVLDLASEFMEVRVGDLAISHIPEAQSAFITSTTKGIMPVTRVDETLINDGRIAPIITRLRDALDEKIKQYLKDTIEK